MSAMHHHLSRRARRFLGGCAASVLISAVAVSPALAAQKKSEPDRLELLEQQIKILQQQVQDLKASQASKYAEVKKATDEQAKVVTLDNGRPTFKKGDFSASLRALVQFDAAYYSGDHAAGGQDLNSGSNFRRARIGLDGTLGKGWDYSFIYDFGGSGVEGSTISAAWIQFSGLKPFKFRLGAFAPYTSLEDSGGASDTLFLERASSVEIARGLAGGDGRSAFQVTAAGDRYFASVAYTGARVGASGTFDEQQALLGRVAGLFLARENMKIILGANGTYIFRPADNTAGPNSTPATFTISNAPELRVDDTGTAGAALSLISSGAISASRVTQWGLDGAAQWKSLYGEGGYFAFALSRRGNGIANSDPRFSGWYAQASWVLTGETRRYDAPSASFRSPKVNKPFTAGPDSGWGAWEAAVRYSVMDLNYADNRSTAVGGIRGGEQDIWTLGLNWYPNNAVRFSLNYLLIDVDRRSGATAPFTVIDQKDQAVALRSQVAF